MRVIFCLIAVILMTTRIHCLVFEDCSVNGEIFSVDIEGCPQPPCRLVIGTVANLTVHFKTNVPAEILREKAYFMVTEVEQDAHVQPNACDALVGASCPLKAGDTAVYKAQALITDEYPPVKGDFVWMLKNEQESNVVCFAVGVRLAYNLRRFVLRH